MASAASTERPLAMAPERASGPSKNARISCTSANGDRVPACPPAPAATAMSPSAPFSSAFRVVHVDDVVQHDPAVALDRAVHVFAGAERRDDDRHLVLHAHGQIVLEPVVRLVHDLVHRERRGRRFGMRRVPRGKLGREAREPPIEKLRRPRVQRRKRADDARFALREHELRLETMNSGAPTTGTASPRVESVTRAAARSRPPWYWRRSARHRRVRQAPRRKYRRTTAASAAAPPGSTTKP